VTLLRQEVGLDDPQRSFPTPAMLGFCEVQLNLSPFDTGSSLVRFVCIISFSKMLKSLVGI